MVNVPIVGYGTEMVVAPTGAAVVTGVLEIGPPFLGTRGGPNPAYGPVRCAGGVDPGSFEGYGGYSFEFELGYPGAVPAGGVRMAPERVPTAFVLPDVVPGTVAASEVDARYTAPPPRELKCPSGEFLGDSVMWCG